MKGYFVYPGVVHFIEPAASFTLLENANRLSELIGSHTHPTEIVGEIPSDIDKYIPQLKSGMHPFDVALMGDGTIFEIDNGIESTGILIYEPEYHLDQDVFSGTFWAHEVDDAVEMARKVLEEIKSNL